MTLSSSSTYIYTYVIFAVVYLASSVAFVVNAVRVSTALSRAHELTDNPEQRRIERSTPAVGEVISHSQRLVDYTQLATLLPLVYVVGSMFLGSLILGGTHHASVNIGWVTLTVAATAASVTFVVLGLRESAKLNHLEDLAGATGNAADALQRIGLRLGVSAALLLLVAVFMTLNLYSILSGIQGLLGVQFLI
ncbi:MAG: hypothetical protein CVT59_08435 [Actinobacteria bacterium HGW-Actinobacteria-1]|nr:MAG: hypothetical protein CVT59_08435 [Actinobacteria bacterium HGW-Actinobacteria-1]